MTENELSKIIVDTCYEIHSNMGPGLLESVYEEVLFYELTQRGLHCERQVAVPVTYKGIRMDIGFKADLIVEDKVILELKSVAEIAPVHKKQLLTYLKLKGKKLGLLINFNSALIKDGITRIVNNLYSLAKTQRRISFFFFIYLFLCDFASLRENLKTLHLCAFAR